MGKRLDFLFFWDAARRDVFWIYLLLIWLFFDPIIKPPKKDYKRKNQKHLCFGGRFAFLFKRSFFGLRVRYFSLSVVVTNFQKIGASSWKKKLNERRKFSVRLSLMNDLAWTTNMFFSSLASYYYYKRIIAKMLLSRSLFFQVVSFTCCIVFRILCTFLAIFFVKIKLKRKINIWYTNTIMTLWNILSRYIFMTYACCNFDTKIDHCVSRAKVERLLFNDL